jgi:CBS domain containing-hemolysin-like protein
MDSLIWIGIAVCLVQSSIFSGLNLAFFSLSRLRLEAEAATGSRSAGRVLAFRRDSNFLLTTILWGNVSINVLLTLLSNSVLAGVAAFAFSTVVITTVGEIMPQAYFSRRAMAVASLFAPLMSVYHSKVSVSAARLTVKKIKNPRPIGPGVFYIEAWR